ncbi:hypothetical protein ACI68E_003150 [Malassezia pachydermatis]
MSYIVTSTSTEERLPALSLFRTFAGIALVIGPILSVVLTLFSFHIGKFIVNPYNSPTFVSSAIALIVALVTAFFVQEKKASKYNLIHIIKTLAQFKEGLQWCLSCAFVPAGITIFSSFLMSNVFFLMSDLLSSPSFWHYNLTLISGLQAIVFFSFSCSQFVHLTYEKMD